MIDYFDGLVVSRSIGTCPDAELVNTMLDAAIETAVNSTDRPVVYSDRGVHYRWPGWLSRIGNTKLICLMSRKRCSPDNAACEGFFGRLKTELNDKIFIICNSLIPQLCIHICPSLVQTSFLAFP